MPSLPPSTFYPCLGRSASLADRRFSRFRFQAGMLFRTREKWWREGMRKIPHEGVDLAIFEDRDGRTHPLPAGLSVPAVYAGEVVKSFADFLGQTVVLAHELLNDEGWRLHSLYGHTLPLRGEGERLAMGEAVARIAPPTNKGPAPPPHLHLTLAWLPPDLPLPQLSWKTLTQPGKARLLDPLCLLAASHDEEGTRGR